MPSKSILLIPYTYYEPFAVNSCEQFYFQFVVGLALGSTWGRHQHRLSHLRCTPCAAHSCTIAAFPPSHPNNTGAASCLCNHSLRGKQSRGECKGVERESYVNNSKLSSVRLHIYSNLQCWIAGANLVLQRDNYAVQTNHLAVFYSQSVVLTSGIADARFFLIEDGHFNPGTEQCNILNPTKLYLHKFDTK